MAILELAAGVSFDEFMKEVTKRYSTSQLEDIFATGIGSSKNMPSFSKTVSFPLVEEISQTHSARMSSTQSSAVVEAMTLDHTFMERALSKYRESALEDIAQSYLKGHARDSFSEFYVGRWDKNRWYEEIKGPPQMSKDRTIITMINARRTEVQRTEAHNRADMERIGWSKVPDNICPVCLGLGVADGEECWHCEGEGIDVSYETLSNP